MWFEDLKRALARQGDTLMTSLITIWAFVLMAGMIGAEAALGPALGLRVILSTSLRWPSIQGQLDDAGLRGIFTLVLSVSILIALFGPPHLLMWGWSAFLLGSAALYLRYDPLREQLTESMWGWWPAHLRSLWADLRALTLAVTGVIAGLLAWQGDLVTWLVFVMLGSLGLNAMAQATFQTLARNADP